jgi:hypothetical protein
MQPLILLDVDGVINIVGGLGQPGIKSAMVGKVNGKFRIDWDPELVHSIHRWSHLAELRWLTSWDEEAIQCLTPALQLPLFPLAPMRGATAAPVQTSKFAVVKHCLLAQPDQPVIWIDDCVYDECRVHSEEDLSFFRTRPGFLVIAPNSFDGLMSTERDRVDQFLANPCYSVNTFREAFVPL